MKTIVKAISVIQPWASALFVRLPNGARLKGIETRSWKLSDKTEYPLRIAIHASKGFPKYAREFAEKEQALGRIPKQLPFGAIIGVISIIGMRMTEDLAPQISALESLYGNYSPERWGWMTSDEKLLPDDKIIFCKGARGLWNVPANFDLRG